MWNILIYGVNQDIYGNMGSYVMHFVFARALALIGYELWFV
jgi:hypothetical protein